MAPNYTLYLGDCLEEMDRIEDGSIDCILADLPYGTTACKWDIVIPFGPLWIQYRRVIKKNGAIVLFGSQPFTSLLVVSNLAWFKYEWVWDKVITTNSLNAKIMPMLQHESILVFSGGRTVFNRQFSERSKKELRPNRYANSLKRSPVDNDIYGKHRFGGYAKDNDYRLVSPKSILQYSRGNGWQRVNALHPTQKPVTLLSYLIKTYTNENDTILDNTCGSGSVLEAAMRCNRRSIGIEKDAHYFEVASQRLASVAYELQGKLSHLPLFTPTGTPT